MTPLLIYGFGMAPHLAVGTDLLFSAVTKSGGMLVFIRQRLVPWRIVVPLASGGIIGVGMMLLFLRWVGPATEVAQTIIRQALGAMLLVTAAVTAYRVFRCAPPVSAPSNPGTAQSPAGNRYRTDEARWSSAPWIMGWAIGMLVTLTSVGAGAIGMALLLMIYPRTPLPRLVAADVTYAVPLTLAAGMGHAAVLGTVDWPLLSWLLLGSLPGIALGARLVHRVPQQAIRLVLSLLIGSTGTKLLIT
jgi:uncharacterized membrane protein YfcA